MALKFIMKNTLLFVVTIALLLSGCFASKQIPTDMAQSMLLVRGNSAKVKQAFRAYKYPYKLLNKKDDYTTEIVAGKTNYLLYEGGRMQRGMGAASPTYVEIILENLSTKKTLLITNVTGGIDNGAWVAVRKLMKVNAVSNKNK